MALLLYLLSAVACLALVHRVIRRISRRFALLLVLLPLAFTGRALLTGDIYAPIDLPYQTFPLRPMMDQVGVNEFRNPTLSDLYAQMIPWKKAVREAYRGTEWPLWNPHQFAGDILAGASQPAPYDPVFLLSLLAPLPQSLTFLASFTFFLLGIWMFVWLREIGLSECGSITGAVAWMFGSFVVFWLEWPMVATVSWLPLVLVGVRRVLRSERRGTVVLLTAFTLMLLAGHPESALHIVTVAGILTLWELAILRSFPMAKIGRLVAAGILALLLAAIYLLPILDAIPQTADHRHRKEIYRKLDRSLPASEAGARMATSFIPFLYGSQHEGLSSAAPPFILPATAYAGSLIFPLAFFGLWKSRFRERWLFAGLAVFGLLIGSDAPVAADLLAALPLFDIAINNRLVFAALFSLAALAALGVDAWLEAPDRKRLALTFTVHTAFILVLLVLLWPWMRRSGLSEAYLFQKALFYLVPLLLATILISLERKRGLAFAVLLLLIVGQRTLEDGKLYPTVPAEAFYPPLAELAFLPQDGSPYRIVGFSHTLIPATATMYGLEDVRGYQAMTFERWKQLYPLWCIHQPVWFNLVVDLTRPFLSFLNVRYAIAPPRTSAPAGWNTIAESDRMTLLENERFIERAFVPDRVRLNLPESQALFEMGLERNFSRRSWIRNPVHEFSGEMDNGPGRVVVRAPSMKRRELSVSMRNPGWIVVSEVGWNGWRALVDGRPVPLRVANHAFLAFHLPAGEHEVTLVYWPRAFVAGALVSFVTAALLLGGWGIRRLRKTRRRT